MDASDDGAVWRLESYFPEFGGPRMLAFKERLKGDLAAVAREAGQLDPLGPENGAAWEAVMLRSEDVKSRLDHLISYLDCLESAHADVEAYALERAAASHLSAELEKLDAVCLKAFKGTPEEGFTDWIHRPALQPIAYPLRRMRERARYTMSLPEELLAADLNVDGLKAWERLYDRMTGKLVFEFTNRQGESERRPISQWRGLMSDEDRDLGRAAFEGGNRAWQSMEDVCAAALNAICGTRLSLYRHRGIAHFLDMPLFQAGIRRETLDALYTAIHQRIAVPRDFLRAKAGLMGRSGIRFFEREAPLPLPRQGTGRYSWTEALDRVGGAFDRVYPALGVFFRQLAQRRWIESQARPGKRQGAFCTGSALTNEQRVFMTFSGNMGSLATLAHEVGHAWHEHLLRNTRPLARRYPMTLAETASVFAESVFVQGLSDTEAIGDSEKLRLLDAQLTDAAVLLLDITTRYEFEKAFHEERGEGEVPVSRLKALMVDTQRRIYGDALLADGADPYFWASKLHFYFTGISFYNFPYTFGFLLTRALVGLFEEKGPPFLAQYERFLELSGSGPVEAVVRDSLGLDLTSPDFWSRSIDGLLPLLEEYRTLGTDLVFQKHSLEEP
jgi:oligoendopeptidase F